MIRHVAKVCRVHGGAVPDNGFLQQGLPRPITKIVRPDEPTLRARKQPPQARFSSQGRLGCLQGQMLFEHVDQIQRRIDFPPLACESATGPPHTELLEIAGLSFSW